MSAIASYRTSILLLLSDPGNALFSANAVDQALRWALMEYSLYRPLLRTTLLDVETASRVHTLPADFATRQITMVELYDEDPDLIAELGYHAWRRDEQWRIKTKSQVEAGEILQVTYSDIHQVDGLDSAAGTTIPLSDEPLLQLGAAGHAAQMRAVDIVETINMNADVVKNYQLLAEEYLGRFYGMMEGGGGVEVGEFE